MPEGDDKPDMNSFGGRLRAARMKCGMTIKELSINYRNI
jgi:hypothetical protein